jgi:4-hydroxythreonine-4-phosphate dehydrogenase
MTRQAIGITIGDPAGVGPELIVRSWHHAEFHHNARLVAIGPVEILQEAARRFAPALRVMPMHRGQDQLSTPTLLPCIDTGHRVPSGSIMLPDAKSGQISFEAVVLGTQLTLDAELDGLVTCPISKAAWHAAGHRIPGHTELLAELCAVPRASMMLYVPGSESSASLGVVHATLHMSLRQVLDSLSTDRIVHAGWMLHDTLRRLSEPPGSIEPRLGIAALNPHAGEQGLFGDEEARWITPAVRQLRAAGCPADGPFPADTLFARAVRGEFDGVVAMYHDQGHIALKLWTMYAAVNVTLGLPIVRTSVAHGTAFDIAWQGIANLEGLHAAITTCSRLVRSQNARRQSHRSGSLPAGPEVPESP